MRLEKFRAKREERWVENFQDSRIVDGRILHGRMMAMNCKCRQRQQKENQKILKFQAKIPAAFSVDCPAASRVVREFRVAGLKESARQFVPRSELSLQIPREDSRACGLRSSGI